MRTKTFSVALNCLHHPLAIAAILILLFNDHWLRYTAPSWWTGKIGDFAWLLFAPFICAAVLTWFIPAKRQNHTRQIGLLACLLVASWFALAKTIPTVHLLTISAWESIIGWHGT